MRVLGCRDWVYEMQLILARFLLDAFCTLTYQKLTPPSLWQWGRDFVEQPIHDLTIENLFPTTHHNV